MTGDPRRKDAGTGRREPMMRYEGHLDGIRAISIIMVMTNHISGVPDIVLGGTGVDIFFALSGWLITNLLISEQEKTGSVSLVGFYVRRVFRIAPLYYLTIALYAAIALGLLMLTGNPDRWQEFKVGLPYLASFNMDFLPPDQRAVFGHAWTLGIEEKFYILWPAAFILIGSRHRVRGAALVAGLGILAVALLFNWQITRAYIGLSFACCTAVVIASNRPFWQRRLQGSSGYCVAALAVSYAVGLMVGIRTGGILIGLSSSLLIASLHFDQDGVIARMLRFPPLAFAGKLTFGIYLMHVLVLNVVEVILGTVGLSWWPAVLLCTYAASVAVAFALRIALEMPMINLGRRIASALRTRDTLKIAADGA